MAPNSNYSIHLAHAQTKCPCAGPPPKPGSLSWALLSQSKNMIRLCSERWQGGIGANRSDVLAIRSRGFGKIQRNSLTVCTFWKSQPKVFKFVVYYPCQSLSSLTILVPLSLITIFLVFIYLSKLSFSVILPFEDFVPDPKRQITVTEICLSKGSASNPSERVLVISPLNSIVQVGEYELNELAYGLSAI